MKKHIAPSLIAAVAVSTLITATTLTAQTTLFSDDFSGLSTNALDGTTPDTTQGGETWDAGSVFNADGSITSAGSNRGAYLNYAFSEGFVYELSADIISTGSDWIALGFAESSSGGDRFTETAVNGRGWLLTRDGGQAVWGGPRATNQLFSGEPVTDTSTFSTYTLKLDTTNASDVKLTVSMAGNTVVNEASLGTFSSLNLGAFGFSYDANAAGSIDNLSLTVIPEPSSYALLAGLLGLGSIMLRRR